MKIKNIGHKNLRVAFNPKKGDTIIVDLKPGQIVFGEPDSVDNKQILILTRKLVLQVSDDDKPKTGEYYKAYGVLPHADIVKLIKPKPSKSSIVLEESDDDESDDDESDDDDAPIVNMAVDHSVLPKEDVAEFIIPSEEEEEPQITNEEENDEEDDEDEDAVSVTEEDTNEPVKNKGGRPKGSLNKKKKKKKSAKKSS